MPVLTVSPVVGHVIEIAATWALLADPLRLAVLSTTHNLSAETSPDRRSVPDDEPAARLVALVQIQNTCNSD
jgi:hypothetical protein